MVELLDNSSHDDFEWMKGYECVWTKKCRYKPTNVELESFPLPASSLQSRYRPAFFCLASFHQMLAFSCVLGSLILCLSWAFFL